MTYTITEEIVNLTGTDYNTWEDFSENGLYSERTRTKAYNDRSNLIQEALTEEEWTRFDNITSNLSITVEWDVATQTATRTKTYQSLDDFTFVRWCDDQVEYLPKNNVLWI